MPKPGDPLEFDRMALPGWTLMDARSLPTLWSEVGQITYEGRAWTIGRSEQSLSLYLMTDIPHPDDPKTSCVFSKNCADDVSALAEFLTSAKATTEQV